MKAKLFKEIPPVFSFLRTFVFKYYTKCHMTYQIFNEDLWDSKHPFQLSLF